MVISCPIAVCTFSKCCHLGLALFEYVEGIFPLCIHTFSVSVHMCTAVAGKALVQVPMSQ